MLQRHRIALPLIVVLLLGSTGATGKPAAVAPPPAGPTALDGLVAAERAFAQMSVEKGVRDAFLAWLADDGVIFRPLATNGRQAWQSRGRVAAALLWEPAFAEVAAAGDLGYTTGPWELRPEDPARPPGYGHYVSVWQRQGDGSWRVAVDIGVSHGKPAHGLGEGLFDAGPVHAGPRTIGALPDLMALDLAWTDDARRRGSAAAMAQRAARDIRFYRDGVPPVLGPRGAREMEAAVPGVTLWDPEAQRVALSGDLGCTYGMLERRHGPGAPPDSSVYLHVWRLEPGGRWKVALALETELPKSGR